MVETLRFETAPDLKRLYAAAAANGRFGGSSAPDVVAERRVVRVDPAAVADYAHLCGFGLGAHPPVTWAHLLGFPLQAAVMSRRDFPVPMVGLVHVENRITWTRPLEYDETLDVRVHAADLRPHRRGRLVDLVAEVTSRDEVVWRGVSTYLARGDGDESAASEPSDRTSTVSRRGPWFGCGSARTPDGGTPSVSGDVNPIHLHALSARAFGFDRAIAHGMFSYARVLASLGARVPAAGSSTVWFRKPVKLPSTTSWPCRTTPGWRSSSPRRAVASTSSRPSPRPTCFQTRRCCEFRASGAPETRQQRAGSGSGKPVGRGTASRPSDVASIALPTAASRAAHRPPSHTRVSTAVSAQITVTVAGERAIGARSRRRRPTCSRTTARVLVARVNGELRDLAHVLADGDVVEPVTVDSRRTASTCCGTPPPTCWPRRSRRSTPRPGSGIGPPIRDGFYYDFDVETPFTPEDLKALEKVMQRIVNEGQTFVAPRRHRRRRPRASSPTSPTSSS